ncbi:MAG TPA: hypothetical protein VHX68_04715 [Planctomycetaceae bacterium]|jgi:hypothetical protein|nr:hypothetical protein [Planctomycetaceae bacterium]
MTLAFPRRHYLTLAACVSLAACGCSRSAPLGQVEGTVRIDGQPIGQVMVVFVPEDKNLPQSMGVTDDLGRFKLRCNNGRAGAAVGQNRVTLVDAATAAVPKGREEDPPDPSQIPPSRIPTVYNRATQTPLRQTVAAGSQTITIDIPADKKPS